MKDEYIIISKTALEKRIEKLQKEVIIEHYDFIRVNSKIDELKGLLSQSTPLIPEIEKAFDAGERYKTFIVENWDDDGEGDQININKKDYILNIKLDI